MSKILYTIGLLFLFQSCLFKNCKEVLISKGEIEWFNYFELGDTLFYISQESSIDTFVVIEDDHYLSNCNKIEIGNYQYDQAWVTAKMINKKYKNYDDCLFTIEFSKQLQKDSITPSYKYFTVFDLTTEEFNDMKMFEIDSIYSIGLKRKVPTISFPDSPKMRSSGTCPIKLSSFNWNKEYGLIRYTLKSGEVFDFLRKSS